MKVYRDLTGIERKERRGRRLSTIGLGVLMVGLLASFVPMWMPPDEPATTPLNQFIQEYWMWISFISLPIGFVFASIGSYYINRFARRRWKGSKVFARPDELLERSLKGFDSKYSYYAWSLPAHYVIAGPCGVIVFAARSDKGRVAVVGDTWREPFSLGRILTIFAREGLGNPAKEVDEQVEKLRTLMEACKIEGNGDSPETDMNELADVPISGAAVFLNPEARLSVENPTMAVLRADQVKEYVRRQAREVRLPARTVRSLAECLTQSAEYDEE